MLSGVKGRGVYCDLAHWSATNTALDNKGFFAIFFFFGTSIFISVYDAIFQDIFRTKSWICLEHGRYKKEGREREERRLWVFM